MQLHPVRGTVVLLCVLFLAPLASAQFHNDEVRGFKFKPPKDYKSIALNPRERVVIARYHDPTMSYGGEQGYQPRNGSEASYSHGQGQQY